MFAVFLVALGIVVVSDFVVSKQTARLPPVACNTLTVNKYPFCDTTLSIDARVSDLISRLTIDEKALLLTARQSPLNYVPRLGIPEYNWGGNCVHGVQSRCTSACPTSFALPVALGATWNRSLIVGTFQWMGIELRALWLEGAGEAHDSGLPHFGLNCWAPTVNIARDPRWGRSYETPSEDPLWNGVFGTLYTLALQNGSERLPYYDARYPLGVVTIKHFDAYSLDKYEGVTRHDFDAVVCDYMLADTYWPAFQLAVSKGRVKGVMCAHNAVNGIPMCANEWMLNETLRHKWGFEGYITSDSGGIYDLSHSHHFVTSLNEAVIAGLKATVDIDSCLGTHCGSYFGRDYGTRSPYTNRVPDLVATGLLDEALVDSSLRNTLTLRFELGLFDATDASDKPYWNVDPKWINAESTQRLNREGAMQSMTLLKNEGGTLPFAAPTSNGKDNGKVLAVIGPHFNASSVMAMFNNGQLCREYGDDSCVPGVLSEFSKQWGAFGSVVHAQGCDVQCFNKSGFSHAIEIAKKADEIVVMLGLDHAIEGEHNDRVDITLPGLQSQLGSALCALKKPTTVVLLNGGIVAIDALAVRCPAILEAWYPGFRGAEAIVATVLGRNNPGGKMPVTMYNSNFSGQSSMFEMDVSAALGKTYKYWTQSVLFPFGFGLSYTSFEMKRNTTGHCAAAGLYCVDVRNTGKRLGTETVFVFMSPPSTLSSKLKASRILRRLVAWTKMEVQSGANAQWKWRLKAEQSLFLFDNSGAPMLYAGDYRLTFTNGNEGSSALAQFTDVVTVASTKALPSNPYLNPDFEY